MTTKLEAKSLNGRTTLGGTFFAASLAQLVTHLEYLRKFNLIQDLDRVNLISLLF